METTTTKKDTVMPKLEAKVYSVAGKEVSTITLSESVFGRAFNADLVHQVTTALAANKRQNRAHTKDRSEVAGGGKKPWKQKGTGRARHGSSRSPIWRHGGITFGPRTERDYSEKINRKTRVAALYAVLSQKVKDGEIVFVDSLASSEPKTSMAVKALEALGKATDTTLLSPKKTGHTALIATNEYNENTIKSFRNVTGVATEELRNLNPLEVLSYRYLVIENPQESLKALEQRAK